MKITESSPSPTIVEPIVRLQRNLPLVATFIRESTIRHPSFTERAPKLGGLVEFYRSPARLQWSPTGTNVPDYPKLAQLWWQHIGDAVSGAKTPQEAMDALCAAQEAVLERLERAGVQGEIGPKLNAPEDPQAWFDRPGAPKPRLDNEDPPPETKNCPDTWLRHARFESAHG